MPGRCFAIALGLALLGVPGGARAESSHPGLNWVRLPGAEQCIGWRELGERVEARLGRALFQGPASADLSLDGHVAPRAGGGFEVRLTVVDAEGSVFGERILGIGEGSCRALDEAIVLVIAVTLDPDSRLNDAGIPLSPEVAERLDRLFRDEPDELAPPPTTAAANGTPVAADGPAGAPDERRGDRRRARARARAQASTLADARAGEKAVAGASRWTFGVLGLAEAGLLPDAALGLAARVWWHPFCDDTGACLGPWAFELHGHWFTPASIAAPDDEAGDATARLIGAGLSACIGGRLTGGPSASAGYLCPGVRFDSMTVEPRGFADDRGTRNDPWVCAQLGTILQVPVTRSLFAEAGLHLLIPLVTREYAVLDSSGARRSLLEPSTIAGRLEVGLGFRP